MYVGTHLCDNTRHVPHVNLKYMYINHCAHCASQVPSLINIRQHPSSCTTNYWILSSKSTGLADKTATVQYVCIFIMYSQVTSVCKNQVLVEAYRGLQCVHLFVLPDAAKSNSIPNTLYIVLCTTIPTHLHLILEVY